MTTCTEFAVFKVPQENIERVIALSNKIFSEMNADEQVILSSQVLQRTDNNTELCWHLTWKNQTVAKEVTAKWPSFPSTKEFQSLVGENVYYGHFINAAVINENLQ